MEDIRNWVSTIAMGLLAVFIVYGSLFQGFLTLGSDISAIKGTTNDIKQGIVGIEKNTERLSNMEQDITTIKERTRAYIGPREGGRLRTLERHTIIDVEPRAVLKEILVEYAPVATNNLPAKLPQGITALDYNFALTPYNLSGLQLPYFSLQSPAEISIAYTYFNSGSPTIKPTDLILLSWSEKEGEWTPIETTIKGNLLRGQITEFTLFSLGYLLTTEESPGS